MNWLFDDPLSICVGAAGVLFFLGVGWMQTGRNVFLGFMAGVVAITGGLLALERYVVTDREAVRARLYELAELVRHNKHAEFAKCFVQSRPEFSSLSSAEFPRYKFTDAHITKIHRLTADPSHQPPQVIAELNGVASGSLEGGQIPFESIQRWVRVVFWKESDGQWRIADYEHDEPTRFMKQPK